MYDLDQCIAFTGSRGGPTDAQRETLFYALKLLFGRGLRLMHNGCATGADEFAALTAKEGGWHLVGHPSNVSRWVSTAALRACHEFRDPMPPLERNRVMVASAALLLACPAWPAGRSGTWGTITLARNRKLPLWLVTPEGKLLRENDG